MKSKPAINTKIRDACKKAGAVGGRVSSDRLTAEQRRQRSIKTGNTTLERFGLDYYAAQKSQQAFDTASKGASPLGLLSKGLSSIGGAASSPTGMQAIKNLAGNNTSATQNAVNTPVLTTTSNLPDQLPMPSDNG